MVSIVRIGGVFSPHSNLLIMSMANGIALDVSAWHPWLPFILVWNHSQWTVSAPGSPATAFPAAVLSGCVPRVLAGRRSRLPNAPQRHPKVVLLGLFDVFDSVSSVEVLSDLFVVVNKSLELAVEANILAGENIAVTPEGFEFTAKIVQV